MALTLSLEDPATLATTAAADTALPAFDLWQENPDQKAQREYADEHARWFSDAQGKLDGVALDPEPWFKDKDLAFDPDPRRAQILALNTAAMDLHGDGTTEVPTDDTALPRKLLMQETAFRLWGIREPLTEEQFHEHHVKDAQRRKDTRSLADFLDTSAGKSALFGSVGETNPHAWPATRAALQALPGYQKAREPDYREAFNVAESSVRDGYAHFATPLAKVWTAMKTPQSGEDLGLSVGFMGTATPVADLQKVAGQAPYQDAAATAQQEFDNVPAKDRPAFMDALGTLARSLPEAEQKNFFRNLARAADRVIPDLAREAGEGVDVLLTGSTRIATTFGEPANMPEIRQAQDQSRQRRDFAREARRISREDFAPTAFVSDKDSWLRTVEAGAYGIPGFLGFIGEAVIPVLGWPLVMASMTGQASEILHSQFVAGGMDPDKASSAADALAPITAVPQAVIMHYLGGNWMGKVPGVNKALTVMSDAIGNRALRFAVKGTVGSATGVAVMDAMNLVPSTVQDLAHTLDAEIPDVRWSGPGGALDAAFSSSWETLVTMAPLAFFGAAGGMNQEARNRAFAEATPLQRAAFGITPEHSARIDAAAARGDASLGQAVAAAMESHDPNSPAAVEAVAELQRQAASQRASTDGLKSLGYAFPQISTLTDGTYAVHDGRSGEEIGRAADLAGVERLAKAHTVAMDDLGADQIVALGTLLMGAAKVSKDTGIETVFDLGKLFDRAAVEAMGPEFMERYAAEKVLLEQAEGGTGDIARHVLGMNVAEVRDGVKTLVNRIFAGGSLPIVFEETWHGLRRSAKERGILTREHDIALLRAMDTVLGDQTTQRRRSGPDGTRLRFIPEGMKDADIPEILLDEAIGAIGQMEILRTPKTGSAAHGIPRAVVARHLGAMSRLAPDATRSFKAFIDAFRARWGLALSRVFALRQAEKSGTFDFATLDAYRQRLLGTGEQDAHDARVKSELARILAMPDEMPGDAIPLALGPPVKAGDFDKKLFDKIGDAALRLEQPKARYEDKRQLLLDFSQSILGRRDESIPGTGGDLGRLGSLQIIRQRLAADLAENLQVGFLGETLKDSDDLAYFAQALRNPRFLLGICF